MICDHVDLKQRQPIQKKDSKAGLPNNIKADNEDLAGMSMDYKVGHREVSDPVVQQKLSNPNVFKKNKLLNRISEFVKRYNKLPANKNSATERLHLLQ